MDGGRRHANSETPMTDAELLHHYINCKRIIHGAQRSPGHYRLLKLTKLPVDLSSYFLQVS